jgi:hypothetical protein
MIMMQNKSASWLTKYITDPILSARPGGPIQQNAAAAQSQANAGAIDKHNAETAKYLGEHILKYTLGGVGVGLSGSKLYHLISSLHQPKQKHTKFGPGAKTVDDDEKVAGLEDMYNTVVSAPGRLIQNISSVPANQDAAWFAAMIGGPALGLYGGSTLMNKLMAQKRKTELKDEVEDAKAEYQKALTGKKAAAALDNAAETYFRLSRNTKEAGTFIGSALGSAVPSAIDAAKNLGQKALTGPFELMQQSPDAWRAYVLATLGLGALSGKMTYDWTRARGKDKAIESAQKARARLSGVSPIYVDPEQLAAIKKIAD